MSVFYLPRLDATFIHIQKNGGQSIRHRLFPEGCSAACFSHDWPEKWPRDRVFCFKRNPLNRMLSAYAYLHRVKRGRPIEEYLRIAHDPAIRVDWTPTEIIPDEVYIKHHMLLQIHPFYMMCRANFVGLFEDFDNEVNRLMAWLDRPPVKKVPHVNKSRHAPWPGPFNRKQRRMIYEYVLPDIEALGYDIKDY